MIKLSDLDAKVNPVENPYNNHYWTGLTVVNTSNVLGSVKATSGTNTVGFKGTIGSLMLGQANGPVSPRFDFKRGYFGCYQDYVIGTPEPVDCTFVVDGSEEQHAEFDFKATLDNGPPAYDLRAFDPVNAPHWMSNVTNVKFSIGSVDPTIDVSKLGVLMDSIVFSG